MISISFPLPPPEMLKQYKDLTPEIYNEILEQYKQKPINIQKNIEGQIENEKKRYKLLFLSQWHGFIAIIITLFLSFIIAYLGHEKVAIAFLTIPVATMIKLLFKKNI
ncbi:MAG: hypothetical protein Ta2D_07980 [Rickettsiales bacterium]|nr:MAG: hypothetical protein Ta2D_07980 [Rickettsiales bacterium]